MSVLLTFIQMCEKITPMAHTPHPHDLARLRRTAPSREFADELRRLALTLDGDDAAMLDRAAEFLLDARQTLRGGRRELAGGRHFHTT